MTNASNLFFPEMGQSAKSGFPILAQSGYKGYEILWAEGSDGLVQAELRKLRVRPRNVQKNEPSYAGTPFAGDNVMSAKVTHDAYHKIADAGLCTTLCLLD